MLTLATVRTGTSALVGAGAVGLRRGLVSAATVARGLKPAAPHKAGVQEQAWSHTGTWTDRRGRTGQADVRIVPQRFWDDGGALMMRSAVTTTLEGTRGSVPRTRTTNLEVKYVTAGVAVNGVSPAYYDALDLVLGPLHFHLLGVEVHLDQVVLDVVGGPGASNLLGAVAGLLDGSGALGEVADLLDQVLAFLGVAGP